MNVYGRTIAALAVGWMFTVPAHAAGDVAHCQDPSGGLGVSRIVEIDTSGGPLYGDDSVFTREESFLGPKEVVLTFDDGPIPRITEPILDTLDKFCTKATFFSVGRMAIAYPATVKDVLARGHTLGSHTWSHPFNLKHSAIERARDEIEKGFAAVALAAGEPIAPFFRFPGLSDSDAMLALLQNRGIAAFTVDVISNDSYIGNAGRLTERTLHEIEKRDGGIILFHDIKAATAKALPEILSRLKAKGFKVVHMRPKSTYTPVTDYNALLQPMLAKTVASTTTTKAHLVPVNGTIEPGKSVATSTETAAVTASDPPVTTLAPAPRTRQAATAKAERPVKLRRQQHADNYIDEPPTVRPRVRKQRQQQPARASSTFFN